MLRYLVTGGNGYIGSITILEIAATTLTECIIYNVDKVNDIDRVHYLKQKVEQISNGLARMKFIHCDLTCRNKVLNSLPDSIQSVIHLAAEKSIPESIEKPYIYWSNHVSTLSNILEYMDKIKCKKIVFASTAAVYNAICEDSTEDSNLLEPSEMTPYGMAKFICEQILENWTKDDKSAISLRIFNPVGAWIDKEKDIYMGEQMEKATSLIPTIIKKLMKKDDIKIFKSKDSISQDGTAFRDFIHVRDVAEMIVKTTVTPIRTPSYYLYNICTNIPTTVLQIANIVAYEYGVSVKVSEESRPGDLPYSVGVNYLYLKHYGPKEFKSIETMVFDASAYYEKVRS